MQNVFHKRRARSRAGRAEIALIRHQIRARRNEYHKNEGYGAAIDTAVHSFADRRR